MQKWMPIRGNFIESNESIIFQGAKHLSNNDAPINPFTPETEPDGIVLYEDMISNGSIEATAEFEEFSEGDFAQIVLIIKAISIICVQVLRIRLRNMDSM